MAFNMGSLVFRMAADTATLRKDMGHAKKTVEEFSSSVRNTFRSIVGLTALTLVTKQFIEMSDAITLANARLKLVTKTTEEYQLAQKEAYRIAQQNMAGLVATQTLFQRLAVPIRDLGGGIKEVSGITEAFASALRVSGASTQEASASILQFSQAMQAGRLNGDEFRSLAESSPRFMRALADGMNVPVGRLKEMSKEGKLTADVIGSALLKELNKLKAEAAGIPLTIGGAFTQLKNDALVATGIFNELTSASGSLAQILSFVGDYVQGFAAAMQALAKASADGSTQLDLVGLAIKGFAFFFEGIVSVGGIAYYTLKNIATTLAGIGAIVAAAISGDWRLIPGIWRDMGETADKNTADMVKFTNAISNMSSKIVQQQEALRNHSLSAQENSSELARLAQRGHASEEQFKKLKNSTGALTAEQKAAAVEAAKLHKSLLDDISALEMNASGTDKLSAAQKLMLKIGEALRDGKIKLKDAEKQEIFARLELVHATELSTKREKELREEAEKSLETELESAAAIKKEVEEQEKANAILGMTTKQQALYNIQLQETKLAKLELKRLTPKLSEAEAQAIQAQIDAQRELIRVMKEGAAKQEAVDSAETAKKSWEDAARDIEKALTDAMVNGFESGKAFAKSIGDWIVNYFKTYVARMIAQSMMGAMSSALSSGASAMGLGGNSGVSNLLSIFGSSGSSSGMLSGLAGTDIGSIFGAGAGGIMGSSALYAGAIGGGSMAAGSQAALLASQTGVFGSAGLSATASAAGSTGFASMATAIPYVGWAIAAVAIASSILKRNKSNHQPAIQNYGYTGMADPFSGHSPNAASRDAYNPQLNALNAGLEASIKAFGGTAADLGFGLFSSHSPNNRGAQVVGLVKNNESGELLYNYNQNGSNESMEQRLQEQIPRMFLIGLQQADLPRKISDYFKQFDANLVSQETVDVIVATASAAHTMAEAFKDLGGPFKDLTNLSVEARAGIAELTGGLEAFMQKVGNYYQQFYSQEEQQALALVDAQRTLDAAGIDTSGLTDKESFRAAVEALDLSKEEDQKKFAAYMNAAGSFASGVSILESLGISLKELTANAPQLQDTYIPVVSAQETTNGILREMLEVAIATAEKIANQNINVNVQVNQPASIEVYSGGANDGGGG